MAHSSLKSETFIFEDCLGFFNFWLLFLLNFFLYSFNEVIKTKYISLELKVPRHVSVISETYNHVHNILELADILPNVFFTTSETERDYYL